MCFLAVLSVKNTGRSGCQKHIICSEGGCGHCIAVQWHHPPDPSSVILAQIQKYKNTKIQKYKNTQIQIQIQSKNCKKKLVNNCIAVQWHHHHHHFQGIGNKRLCLVRIPAFSTLHFQTGFRDSHGLTMAKHFCLASENFLESRAPFLILPF